MQVGIDSFAAQFNRDGGADAAPGRDAPAGDNALAMEELLQRIELADAVGLDVFGIGEHHRREFLDSAPAVILAAAAARTKNIRLTSAVTVLSADDPVRVFQAYATLDLISKGRAEMVVGRGSSIEAFPLFGYDLNDYDRLFAAKLDLLLHVRDHEFATWSGPYRPKLENLPVYPRPVQKPLPIWLGVGGTPGSFVRAGTLGLPLMVAIIGGETDRFRPLVDLYREAWLKAGHPEANLRVGLHSLGHVAETPEQAEAEFYPGYARTMTRIGKERGWAEMTPSRFKAQLGPRGALLVGGPEDVAAKILRHGEALGGITRVTFQLDTASLPHERQLEAIRRIGERLAPIVRAG
jgi:probable LLM family oxidoreductase